MVSRLSLKNTKTMLISEYMVLDGTIIIWHQVGSRADIATFGEDEEEERAHEKEFWKEKRMIV
jgi:hypothetical protein